MIGVALYVLVVSVIVSIGGWLTDRILASLGWPRRGAWIAAMLLTVAIPAWQLPIALPDQSPVQVNLPPSAPISVNPIATARQARLAPGRARTTPAGYARTRSASSSTRPIWTATVYQRVLLLFLTGWTISSAVLLGRLLAGARALRRRARQWTQTVLDGVAVTVSDDLGPAVLGFLRPRIILPQWLPGESAQRRSAVLAHESEHLRAHDEYFLLGGWLLVALIPWNLPLWWLWQRLRLSIEIDCDARVVHRGLPAPSYGAELLAIATRIPAPPRPAIGLFERPSQLAGRIRILVRPSRRWWRWAALPLYALTGLAALAAGTFPAPPIDTTLGAWNQSQLTARQLSELRAQDTRATRQLLATGQPDALAAAAILGWPYPDGMQSRHGRVVVQKVPSNAAQRLAWLSRAVEEAPDRVDLVMLEKDYCQMWNPRCTVAALDARLRALQPQNGLGWLDALETSVKAEEPTGIDAALAAIGQAKHVDVYRTHLFAHLVDALHRIGGESFEIASAQLNSIQVGTIRLNAMIAFERVCNWNASVLSTRRLKLCRNATLAFEQGDTLEVAESGAEVAMRLWPVGTPQHRRAVIALRRMDYLSQQSARLLWPPDGVQRVTLLLDPWGHIERMDAREVRMDSLYPREQDALRAELIDAGIPLTPPPHSKDPKS